MIDVEQSFGLRLDAIEEACYLMVSIQSIANLSDGQYSGSYCCYSRSGTYMSGVFCYSITDALLQSL